MLEKKEKLRLDKYLWSIRIFKTRSLASDACEKGKIKQNGVALKASKNVVLNDVYEIKTAERKWIIQVTGLLDHRVQYTEAIKFYIDITPEEQKDLSQIQPSSFHTGKRLSKIGRPTKKQRRNMEDFID